MDRSVLFFPDCHVYAAELESKLQTRQNLRDKPYEWTKYKIAMFLHVIRPEQVSHVDSPLDWPAEESLCTHTHSHTHTSTHPYPCTAPQPVEVLRVYEVGKGAVVPTSLCMCECMHFSVFKRRPLNCLNEP